MKHVNWAPDVQDPVITRTCLCEGCPGCRNRSGMYCDTFTHEKCNKCKDYRCHKCLYNKDVCNYCMRIA